MDDIKQAIFDGYFANPQMVRFLMAENLALKSYLHKKGLLDPEEFKEEKIQAEKMLEEQVKKDLVKTFNH